MTDQHRSTPGIRQHGRAAWAALSFSALATIAGCSCTEPCSGAACGASDSSAVVDGSASVDSSAGVDGSVADAAIGDGAAADQLAQHEESFGLDNGNATFANTVQLNAQRFANTAGSGVLIRLELLVDDDTPTGSVRLGVYADEGGTAGSLLLDAGEVAAADGWIGSGGLALPVAAGTHYWLAFIAQDGLDVRYQNSGQPAGCHNYRVATYGPLPADFGTSTINDTPYVMRATVRVDGAADAGVQDTGADAATVNDAASDATQPPVDSGADAATCSCAASAPCITAGPCTGSCGRVVAGAGRQALQTAIDSAAAGDTIFVPAGDYLIDSVVAIDKALTLCGAATLEGVAVMEDGAEEPPAWSGPPSRLYTGSSSRDVLVVAADQVTLAGLAIEGIPSESASGTGVQISGHDGLIVRGCEISGFERGISYSQSQANLVAGCYIHENYTAGLGYGLSIVGTDMVTGGSQVLVHGSEFADSRHEIASNSPQTRWLVEDSYFRDNHQGTGFNQPALDGHPQGGATLRGGVRRSWFKNTRPLGAKSGVWEITDNTFHASCGDVISQMLLFGAPTHNSNYIATARNHHIYIGDNANQSAESLLAISSYDYPGIGVRWCEYDVFVDGELWEATHTTYDAVDQEPSPFIGHIFVTQAGTSTRTRTLVRGTWYDLHLMAVDPQGAGDIAEIALQLVNLAIGARAADVPQAGDFSAASNYFVHAAPSFWRARQNEGTATWTSVTGSGLYLDASQSSWQSAGSQRVHLTLRLKLLPAATPGTWTLFGWARDQAGHLPIAAWLGEQDGWTVSVR